MPRKTFFERPAPHIINFGWAHGRYADYWSLVHFLTGVIFGMFVLLFHAPSLISFIVLTIGMAVYEFLEIMDGIAEDFQNSLFDVVIGSLGAICSLKFLSLIIAPQHWTLVVTISVILNLLFIRQGWQHYLKRKSSRSKTTRPTMRVLYFIYVLGGATAAIALIVWLNG